MKMVNNNMEEKILFEQRKEMIRNMIHDEDYIPLKLKEMAYLMNVPHKDREKLKEVMDALVADGSVELTARGKYIRPQNENLTGIFTAHPKGFGFVRVEGETEDIFIPETCVNGACHQDVVRIKVRRAHVSEGKRKEGVVLKIIERGTKTLVGTFEKSKTFGFVCILEKIFLFPENTARVQRSMIRWSFACWIMVQNKKNRKERSSKFWGMEKIHPQM